jgi:ribonuclease HI/quercetin dioxygenase-like cupin family protein
LRADTGLGYESETTNDKLKTAKMRLTIRTDGGSRGNPGSAGAGVVVEDRDNGNKRLFAGGFYLGEATSNVAEYAAVLRALELAEQLGGTQLEIYCDSELVVKQINGQYRVKNANLKKLHQQVVARLGRFDRVTVRHVYRSDNTEADSLVNRTIDAGRDVGGMTPERKTDPKQDLSARPNTEDTETPQAIWTAVDLTSQANFSSAGPCRVVLGQQSGLKSELICLQLGQRLHIKPKWSQATITVLRGRGMITAGLEKKAIAAGSWLHLGPVEAVDLTPDEGEQLVVIITGQV